MAAPTMHTAQRGTPWTAAALCAVWLGLASAAPVQAAAGLFGQGAGDSAYEELADGRRWELRGFGHVMLAAAEAKSTPNAQPVQLEPAVLRARLAGVKRSDVGAGEALWEASELEGLVPALVRALSVAQPGEDIVCASAAPRGGWWQAPTAVSARVFVHDGALNLIVGDTSLRVADEIRRTGIEPAYAYGAREKPSQATLSSPHATAVRPDWLRFDLAPLLAAAAAAPAGSPKTTVAPPPAPPASPQATPLAAPAPTTPAAAAAKAPPEAAPSKAPPEAAPSKTPPAAAPAPSTHGTTPAAAPSAPAASSVKRLSADEMEERLTTLNRLRDKGLISQEEYQRMRASVLSGF